MMTAYRTSNARLNDVETDAIVDLRRRIERLRRKIALPIFVVAGSLVLVGAFANAFGYWPAFGTLPDGSYTFSAFTMLSCGLGAASPVLLVGIPLYVALRARIRSVWREEVRRKDVTEAWPEREAWLAQTSRRFS